MPKCFCNNHTFYKLRAKDFFYDGINEFTYNICKSCGSFYLQNNSSSNINYSKDYYSINRNINVSTNYFKALRYNSNSLFSKILRYFKPISIYDKVVTNHIKKFKPIILDYGSGNSYYINFLKTLKISNSKMISYDPYSNDLNTYTNLREIDFNELELIISNQVFEHLERPVKVLNDFYKETKPSCNIIFSVPVVGSVLTQFKDFSFTLQAPDHVMILTIETWKKLIKNTKWKIKKSMKIINLKKIMLKKVLI